ncbi:MAG: flagellar basal body P-ring formation chaperone FlgA [Pseudomonadota bacterium]
MRKPSTRPHATARLLFASVLLALAGAAVGDADQRQELAALETAILEYVEAEAATDEGRVEVEVGYIDPRLRLTRCAHAPEAFTPPGTSLSGRTTVGVRCREPESWTVYIPAIVRVNVPVVVTNGFLQRNRQITADDVSLEEYDTGELRRGYYRDPDEVIGMVPRTGIGPDTVLRPSQLQPPLLIHRGDRVSIQAGSEHFRISMEGEAEEDGRKGETVRVRNLSSGREIDAVVVAPGRVRVRGD